MHVDAITLAAVADEWRTLLANARIDTIIQPTEHAIAIQCYAPAMQDSGAGGGQNRWLYLSTHPQLARAHITARKPTRIQSEPPPFVMLLRKYLEGARIEAIQQPRWERVIELIASHRIIPESQVRSHYHLIIEIMGRLSNIIFCDEHNMILGSLKRVGAEINRYRTIAANIQYVPPPAQQRTFAGQTLPKLEPATVSAAELALCARDQPEQVEQPLPTTVTKPRKRTVGEPTLWQLLTHHLLGFSPLIAREAVYRTTGKTELSLAGTTAELWDELAWNVHELAVLFDNHHWQPQLVERIATGENQSAIFSATQAVPLAFAPYVLEQYQDVSGVRIRQSPSINILLDDFYARSEWRDAMEGVRNPIRKVLQTQHDRCKRKVDLLQQELTAIVEAAQYRLQAELLLAHQHQVQQGQSSVTLQNFFESESQENAPTLTFSIDPRFDAVGNANRLFNKYHKLRRAAALLPSQIEQNATELAIIDQLLADLMLADTPGRSCPGQSRSPGCWLYAWRAKITGEESSENSQERQRRETSQRKTRPAGRWHSSAPAEP